jgi:methionyl aminopeptidase
MLLRNVKTKYRAQASFPSLVEEYWRKYRIRLKDQQALHGIARAGELVVQTLAMIESCIQPGVTTDELDTKIHEFTIQHDAIPAPLNYQGFPKSSCISVNHEICHGIPGPRRLQEGDIVNVDVTSILQGWYADANRTFAVGQIAPQAEHLMLTTRQCLSRAIEVVQPGATLGDIGWAIQSHAEQAGYSIVRELTGHGVGHAFHELPQIFHTGRPGKGLVLVPGMVFTIEPMLNAGAQAIKRLDDGWTIVTADGSLSAQYEQTLLVTDTGVRSLTPFSLEPL